MTTSQQILNSIRSQIPIQNFRTNLTQGGKVVPRTFLNLMSLFFTNQKPLNIYHKVEKGLKPLNIHHKVEKGLQLLYVVVQIIKKLRRF